MASDLPVRDQLFSKMKSKITSSLSFRQTSTTSQADGSLSSTRQPYFKSLSRSSTINLLPGNAEPKNDHGAGNTLAAGDSTAQPQPRTTNVVLFGETGVGKSSVINLIARKEIAQVSSDVNGCTMQSTRYDIPFDGTDFAIFDTIGLEEPQMGVNGYLSAIEKAYELITRLTAAGGIHLLLFCMRGGRITATTQSNYRLFCECLCSAKVPIALVFTGLEREVEMEDWWKRNKDQVERYGIQSKGHVCITAVQDDTPGEDLKYTESQKKIRELLKVCALRSEPFAQETHTWFARLAKGLMGFVEKHKKPKSKKLMSVLTRRCKLDPETAKKIVNMMEKGDTETTGGNPAEPSAGWETANRPSTASEKDGSESAMKNTANADPGAAVGPEEDQNGVTNGKVVNDDTLANPKNDVKADPRPVVLEEQDERGPMRKTTAEDSPSGIPTSQHHAGTEHHAGQLEEADKGEDVDAKSPEGSPLRNLQNDAEAGSHHIGLEWKGESEITNESSCQAISQSVVKVNPCPPGPEAENTGGVTNQRATIGCPLTNPQNNVEAGPHAMEPEREKSEDADDRDFVDAHSRTDSPEANDRFGSANKWATKGSPLDSVNPQNQAQNHLECEADPHAVGSEEREKSEGQDRLRVIKGRPLDNPQNQTQNDVESKPQSVGSQGRDTSGVTHQRVAQGRPLGEPQDDVRVERSEPHPTRHDKKDRSGVTNENAVNNPVPAIPPRHPGRVSADRNRSAPPVGHKGGFAEPVRSPAMQQGLTSPTWSSGSTLRHISSPT